MMSASTYLINPLQQILEAIASIQSSQVIKDKLLTFGSEAEIPSKGHHITYFKRNSVKKTSLNLMIIKRFFEMLRSLFHCLSIIL